MISVEERQALSSAATLFKVLGHPARVQILDMLITQVMSVSMIASELSISQSSASKHLSLMREHGLVTMERQNGQVLCSVQMKCAQFLLACAKNPDTVVVPSITPVPFRPGCE
ncbi:MAG: winged helix-turn-helix transcriptional regulator [Sphaerochaetaceae bacterium]|nr:winged helix-turn-helix transcriptional regulator [Sphaerochaetaceae bacterium]